MSIIIKPQTYNYQRLSHNQHKQQKQKIKDRRHHVFTLVTSTPVMFLTIPGTRVMISITSPVSLAAPTSELPLLTIVNFFAWDRGAATSAATFKRKVGIDQSQSYPIRLSINNKKSQIFYSIYFPMV